MTGPLLKTFQRQHIVFNMWKIVKKIKCLVVAQKVKMLNFCSKVKKVFKIARNVNYCSKFKKSAEKVPSTKIGKCLLLG